ncbi:MAG: glycosyltransferase family 2 protein, partial [Bacteroidota bacterium]
MEISGVVIAFNEEAKIEACLRSLREVCDEIIVLDSGSSDGTVVIAQNLGAKVFTRTFQGYVEQKNAVIQFAKNEWILSLDADEVLSQELIEAILRIKDPLPQTAFRFKRLNNYCGKWIRHGAWYPDRKIRLWHQHLGTWGGQNPHDRVIVQAGVTIVDIP